MSNTFCGTPPYISPEVLAVENRNYLAYNPFRADVWALAVILYRLYENMYPFTKKRVKALKYIIGKTNGNSPTELNPVLVSKVSQKFSPISLQYKRDRKTDDWRLTKASKGLERLSMKQRKRSAKEKLEKDKESEKNWFSCHLKSLNIISFVLILICL